LPLPVWHRFLPNQGLPQRKVLPLVDKPIIQYIVELWWRWYRALISFRYSKRSIEDHFDSPQPATSFITARGGAPRALLKHRRAGQPANFNYVRQKGSVGNARPLCNVEHLITKTRHYHAYATNL